VLSYRLEGAPKGAAIDAAGVFTWTPTEAQWPRTNVITVVVTADGDWTNLGSKIVASEETASATDNTGVVPMRLYRVVLVQP
jgi:hypothetical protein